MRFTGRNLWVVEEALYAAIEFETGVMDAHRDRYKDEWVPAEGLEEGFTIAKNRHSMFHRLLKRVKVARATKQERA